MSVEYIKRLAGPYIGDGTGQKTFSFGFLIFEESDVYVAVATSSDSEPSDLQQGTDYTVSMNADQSATPGGTITLTSESGLAKDAVLVIGSAVDYTQTLDLTNYTRFAPERITTELDRIVVMIQQIVELLGRVVQVPPTSSISPSDLFFQLLNAAESAAQSAEDAAASLAACEQIRQLIEQYSWDIPHVVDSLRDVENYPYDGLFAVAGFGNAGGNGQNISNRYVKAEGSTKLRTLGERFADVVNVRDFGAVGDGVTDDTEAFIAAWKEATKQVFWPDYVPPATTTDFGRQRYHRALYLPHGRYKITKNCFLNESGDTKGYNNWYDRIFGDGMAVSQIIFMPEKSDEDIYIFDSTRANSPTYVGLELTNLAIICDKRNCEKDIHGFRFSAYSNHAHQAFCLNNFWFNGTGGTKFYEATYPEGETPMATSENLWSYCRFYQLDKGLILDNQECLHTTLNQCHFWSQMGDVITLKKGSEIDFINCGFIFESTQNENEAAVINVESVEAQNNATQINFYGCRLEGRGEKSRLIRSLSGRSVVSVVFDNCAIHKFDHGQAFGKVAISNGINIAFYNCTLPSNSTGSKLHFVDNPDPYITDSTENVGFSCVTFKDCITVGGAMYTASVDFYCDYSEVTLPDNKKGQTVIYENCRNLPNCVEHGSPLYPGLTYQAGSVYSVPFLMTTLPYSQDGVVKNNRYPKLKLPLNSYVCSVNIVGGSAQVGDKQNVVIECVDETELNNPGTGTVFGATKPFVWKNAINEEIVINKVFSSLNQNERMLYLRESSESVANTQTMSARLLTTSRVFATVL